MNSPLCLVKTPKEDCKVWKKQWSALDRSLTASTIQKRSQLTEIFAQSRFSIYSASKYHGLLLFLLISEVSGTFLLSKSILCHRYRLWQWTKETWEKKVNIKKQWECKLPEEKRWMEYISLKVKTVVLVENCQLADRFYVCYYVLLVVLSPASLQVSCGYSVSLAYCPYLSRRRWTTTLLSSGTFCTARPLSLSVECASP